MWEAERQQEVDALSEDVRNEYNDLRSEFEGHGIDHDELVEAATLIWAPRDIRLRNARSGMFRHAMAETGDVEVAIESTRAVR